MYSVKEYEDKFKMYELRDESTNSWVRVCPERGAIITSYGVHGTELLYLDKDTFYDEMANIRGGIPILFPISGQLELGKYEVDGTSYTMKNHGVARINPWEVIETSSEDSASIKLRLMSSEETEKAYPFKFELVFTYKLKNGKLAIEQEYHNKSEKSMPLYAGFHPYFEAKDKNISYETDSSKYLDYNDMVVKEYTGSLDLTHMVESAIFLDSRQSHTAFKLPELNRRIQLEYGDEFKYVVVWSVKDKDFVCVEPWMAKNKAFNTKEDLQYIDGGKCLKTNFTISAAFKV